MSGERLDKDKTNVPPETLLKCSECLKEVPPSEAFVREGADYTLYFCGLECFDKWRSENPEAAPSDMSDRPSGD